MGSSNSDNPSLPRQSDTDSLGATDAGRYLDTLAFAARGVWTVTLAGVRPVAFWSAVVLPLCYLPSLYGVGTGQDTGLFVELVAWHVAAILLGHGHTPFWSR
ncbi:hypothetical protein BVU17_14870 [Haloarcula taiwanensis]|uniref:Uncharacterized protein n=1 Tax=Haloarcula taiwanensis TaxID=1932004 RepID=A0A2H5A208_9EURY|nr:MULTISPECIES: hypothetical protein [Haloarcula]AUG48745.1 hypothetical protein BVU17_14870 [Haloarcula taiwanensis]RLM48094.1 hypothetical protein DVK00_06225 [Haloarcula sp. Atlit-47R]RLM96493.1 hypothetical protein D3D01_08785 [Haloarcula sp. Atlit-7R]